VTDHQCRAPSHADRLSGLLVATAVGDALGLPYEGAPAKRVASLLGTAPVSHRMLPFGIGLVSDDTEHAALAARALVVARGDTGAFASALGHGLRRWLLGVPPGVGVATLRAAFRLWFGVAPDRSGVRSAGNGPAMRSPIIGAFHRYDDALRVSFTRASTLMTHSDPRAEIGAQALSQLAAMLVSNRLGITAGRRPDWAGVLAHLRSAPRDVDGCTLAEAAEWQKAVSVLDQAAQAPGGPAPAARAAELLGCGRGVSGYAFHSVPVAVYCWWLHTGSLAQVADAAVRLGGDTDSVAASACALEGASRGLASIQADDADAALVRGIRDWPLGISELRALGSLLAAAASGTVGETPSVSPLHALVPIRSALVVAIVVAHQARRLLPSFSRGG